MLQTIHQGYFAARKTRHKPCSGINTNNLIQFSGKPKPEHNRIMIVTDAWNNLNGVVTTIRSLSERLRLAGYQVRIIHPQMFPHITLKKYGADIAAPAKLSRLIETYKP